MKRIERSEARQKVLSKVPSKMFSLPFVSIWCLFTLMTCMCVPRRRRCRRWWKLKFHSSNRDIIKVLVSWKRNEIFFYPPPPRIVEKKRSERWEEMIRERFSNIMSFNATSLSLAHQNESFNTSRHDRGIKLRGGMETFNIGISRR